MLEHMSVKGKLKVSRLRTLEELLAGKFGVESIMTNCTTAVIEHKVKQRLDLFLRVARIVGKGRCLDEVSMDHLIVLMRLTQSPRLRILRAMNMAAAATRLGGNSMKR